ncbi:MAG: hypothetical protein KC486_32710 [Myxococcales bacterium]|nr:hypothetical protein [Myxococcales bacterium]
MATRTLPPFAAALAAVTFCSWTTGCAGDDSGSTGTTASASDSDSDSDGGSTGEATSASDSDGGSTGGESVSDSDTDSGTSDGTTGGACPLDVELEVLSALLVDLGAVSQSLSGGASTLQPAGFLVAPGFSDDKAVFYAAALDEACGEASVLDPVCEGERCWQVSCTGVEGDWSVTAWLDPLPAQAGDFTFSDLSAIVSWSEAEGAFSYQITSKATKGPATWGVNAHGGVTGTGFDVVALLPELVDAHETVLVAAGEGGTFSGELQVDGIGVASVGADGSLTPTGACF